MEIVINEWFVEYFKPETNEEKRQLLSEFISWVHSNNTILFIIKDSEFDKKIMRYSKMLQSYRDVKFHDFIKKFISLIYLNSSKVKFVEAIDIDPLVHSHLKKEKTNFISDLYLFQAASQTGSRIIITTDNKLISHMDLIDHEYELLSPINFLSAYK